MDWYRCSVRSFFLFFFWCFNVPWVCTTWTQRGMRSSQRADVNFGRVFLWFLITTVLHIVNIETPFFSFKDLFGSAVFGFVQSDLRSNIAVRLCFLTVCLNSSRYPHFLSRLLSSFSLVIVILYQNVTSRPYFVWLLRAFVPSTTLQFINLEHWKL